MHPEFFTFSLFGSSITLHYYGVLIAIGAFFGYLYLARAAKAELGIPTETIQGLARWIIIAAIVGGKLLFYLEKPAFYFGNPANMLNNFRTGFVFYGSLLFAVPAAIWYIRRHKVPVLPLLDRLAITSCIIHGFGRWGCFMAGCCYGLPTDHHFGVTFTDPLSKAPLHESLHPTQLYEVSLITVILAILIMFKRHKRFEGQLFIVYVVLYAVGRSITELFRGDMSRGYIIDGLLTHSQFISILLVGMAIYFYSLLSKKSANS